MNDDLDQLCGINEAINQRLIKTKPQFDELEGLNVKMRALCSELEKDLTTVINEKASIEKTLEHASRSVRLLPKSEKSLNLLMNELDEKLGEIEKLSHHLTDKPSVMEKRHYIKNVISPKLEAALDLFVKHGAAEESASYDHSYDDGEDEDDEQSFPYGSNFESLLVQLRQKSLQEITNDDGRRAKHQLGVEATSREQFVLEDLVPLPQLLNLPPVELVPLKIPARIAELKMPRSNETFNAVNLTSNKPFPTFASSDLTEFSLKQTLSNRSSSSESTATKNESKASPKPVVKKTESSQKIETKLAERPKPFSFAPTTDSKPVSFSFSFSSSASSFAKKEEDKPALSFAANKDGQFDSSTVKPVAFKFDSFRNISNSTVSETTSATTASLNISEDSSTLDKLASSSATDNRLTKESLLTEAQADQEKRATPQTQPTDKDKFDKETKSESVTNLDPSQVSSPVSTLDTLSLGKVGDRKPEQVASPQTSSATSIFAVPSTVKTVAENLPAQESAAPDNGFGRKSNLFGQPSHISLFGNESEVVSPLSTPSKPSGLAFPAKGGTTPTDDPKVALPTLNPTFGLPKPEQQISFGQTAPSSSPSFGQSSFFGQNASVPGQTLFPGQTAPSFGQSSSLGQNVPSFGQSSSLGQNAPMFGRPSALSGSSLFSAQPTFGQSSSFGTNVNVNPVNTSDASSTSVGAGFSAFTGGTGFSAFAAMGSNTGSLFGPASGSNGDASQKKAESNSKLSFTQFR